MLHSSTLKACVHFYFHITSQDLLSLFLDVWYALDRILTDPNRSDQLCARSFRSDAKDGILDAAAGSYFTLEACVRIHFHVYSPNLLSFPPGVLCAFARILTDPNRSDQLCARSFRSDAKDGILDAAAGSYFTWKLVFASTSIYSPNLLSSLVCCAHLLAFLPIQTALISYVRDRSAAMQKLLLFATATHFTLKAHVRIHFHITSPNCSPFPLVCDLKYVAFLRFQTAAF